MKALSLSRLGIGTVAAAGVLLGSLAFAAPASANGGAGVVPVGTVCGAAPHSTITVSQTGGPASAPVKYVDAIAKAVAADKPALSAQRDRNVAAGLTKPAVKAAGKTTWQAQTDASGCASIPATGSYITTVEVKAGDKSAVVTYAPTYSIVDGKIVWTEHTTADGAVANERNIEHKYVQAGRVNYNITLQ